MRYSDGYTDESNSTDHPLLGHPVKYVKGAAATIETASAPRVCGVTGGSGFVGQRLVEMLVSFVHLLGHLLATTRRGFYGSVGDNI